MRRLEEAGIITGYRVEIDREALGLPVLAIVRMSCDGVKYRPFLKAVQAMERVMECHHVAGGDAFILKVAAGSVRGVGAGGGEAAGFRRADDEHRILVAGGAAGAAGGTVTTKV